MITFSRSEIDSPIFPLTAQWTVLFFTVGNGKTQKMAESDSFPPLNFLNLRKEPPIEHT